ncbi:hypothetical protein THAOC_16266 [Thalassiosira oceanica]|uniref:Uncharacterized protein n=1 Tax=Thalassiosira oceanica TaxID=159749 RepID=K0SXZ1_THAOC|nr:hypothetical protein THAOC_16266 [Thalassiosira oceanica]|eukprot:EJK63097.1 hypothetical protein THAOC_16266 [Thalassiosira oceanica]
MDSLTFFRDPNVVTHRVRGSALSAAARARLARFAGARYYSSDTQVYFYQPGEALILSASAPCFVWDDPLLLSFRQPPPSVWH